MLSKILKDKIFLSWIVFLLLSLIIVIRPIPYDNLTMQLEFDRIVENQGESNVVTIDFLNSKDSYSEEVNLLDGGAFVKFHDIFIDSDTIISIHSSKPLELNHISIYSGNYDTATDREIFSVSDLHINVENENIKIPQDVLSQMHLAINHNNGLKFQAIIVLFFILVVYDLYYANKHRVKRRLIIKIFQIISLAFLVVYCLFVFVLPDYNYMLRERRSNCEVETIETNKNYNEITFTNGNEPLYGLIIPVSNNPESTTDNVYILIEDEDGNTIFSSVKDRNDILSENQIKIFFQEPLERIEQEKLNLKLISVNDESETPFSLSTLEESRTIQKVSDISYVNLVFFFGTLLYLLIVLTLSFCYEDFRISKKKSIQFVYFFSVIFIIAQIFYYSIYVGHSPDEPAHMSYVEYILENKTIIPNFYEMEMYDFSSGLPEAIPGTINYLGHPPLYYWFLAICQMLLGGTTFNLVLLRLCSTGIGLIAIGIFMGLGYKYLSKKNPIVHLIYIISTVSLPFFLYSFSGLNNDILSLLGVVISFWGILRFENERKNLLTYFLLSLGIFITVFSKITAGIVLIFAYSIYILWTCRNEKSLSCVLNKNALIAIPFMIIGAWYFLAIFFRYGSFQPPIPYDYLKTTDFFVDYPDRTCFTQIDYFKYFFTKFIETWGQINSHVSIIKSQDLLSLDRCIFYILPLSPILFFKQKKDFIGKKFIIGVFLGIIVAIIGQYFSAINSFSIRGYMGGFQSRYYICWMPVFAFGFAFLYNNLLCKVDSSESLKKVMNCISFIIVIWFVYSSFIYTLLHW